MVPSARPTREVVIARAAEEHPQSLPSGSGVTQRSEAVAAGVGACCIAAITAIGAFLFFGPGLGPFLTLAPVAGIAAALSSRRYLTAAVTAALGVVAGSALAMLALRLQLSGVAAWLPPVSLTAVVAAAIAAALVWVLSASPRLERVLAGAAIALLILAGTASALGSATATQDVSWATGQASPRLTFLQALQLKPVLSATTGDQSLYLVLIHDIAVGRPFHQAQVADTAADNRAHPDSQVLLDAPLTYRLPTVYVMLAALPNDGVSWLLAALALAALAAIAAFFLARRFVSAPVALVGCAAVVAYGATIAASPGMLLTESWAGLLALCSLAFLVQEPSTARRRALTNAAAMLLATMAALTSELAVAFVLVGLAASLFSEESRRERHWIWWTAGLVGAFSAYVVHWHLALNAFRDAGLPAGRSSSGSRYPYIHADGLGLLAAIDLAARVMRLRDVAFGAAYVAGVAGALLAPGTRRQRTALILVGVGGSAALALLRPPAVTSAGTSLPPGHWGMIVLPSVLACAPLVLSRLGAVVSRSARGGQPAYGESVPSDLTEAAT